MTSLAAGTRMGPYEIQTQIGAGGMGEVYKAVDTRLDRIVAIKVLPPQWAENTEMRQRFEREAQIIASLNHPNICVLHDIGTQDNRSFLVMEYLEGETLAARISREPVPWDEALKVAIMMADALDKAHRRGVVHRDLKPSNVILTESGPKILDFGLAKWKTPRSGSSISASQAPTRTDLTTMGSILGTLQYMAPEQLEGIEADARTDIFSFGAVLHEMVTGKKAFEGKSRVLLMSAIATSAPDPLSVAQPESPVALDHVVKTCLAKDPDERWQTARDLLAELEWVAETGGDTGLKAPAASAWWKGQILSRALPVLAALLVAALAAPAWFYFRGAQATEEFRFRIPVSATAAPASVAGFSANNNAGANFALSPDGRSMVYATRVNFGDPFVLYVRPLGSVTPQKLAGTEGAELPFWSADGRSIGFIAAGKLKKIEATGGPPQDICETTSFQGGTWNLEGAILFGTPSGLFRVSAQGGKPEAVTSLGQEETGHFWPRFLPDGRRFLYTVWTGQAAKRAVYVGTLGSKERTRVLAAESNVFYAEPGYLVFQRENTVYAQAFQAGKLALTGEPVRLADEVAYSSNGQGSFAVSPSGVLVYFQGGTGAGGGAGSAETADWQLAWVDRGGRVAETVGPTGPYRGLEVSPDGKRVAVHRHEAAGGDIWVIEPRGSVTRLTFDASHHNSMPVWSPDGNRIVYSALQKGKWGLYQTQSSGSGKEELLFESESAKAPMSWSPDGKRIVFWVQDAKTGSDLWMLPLEGDKKPAPLIASPAIETHGQISPDGQWIAYTSNATGRNEVYVQPFPAGSGRYQISNRGGDWPRWKRDSKELLYHSIAPVLDAAAVNIPFTGPLLSAAVVAKGGTLEPDSPKEIVRMTAVNIPHSGGDYLPYAISADAQRILYPQLIPATSVAQAGSGPGAGVAFSVAMHWAK